jgi:hypothetical protein
MPTGEEDFKRNASFGLCGIEERLEGFEQFETCP